MIDFNFKDSYNIDDLVEIVKILRSPGGCAWDMEQTHSSIRMDFIEEVYEAVEAIDNNDSELLREELGDVLLQVVFHTQIEREKGTFDLDDVCDEVCKKMIVRHPHVFGEVSVSGTGDILNNWEAIKQETKGQTTFTETLESVAVSLPALLRAQKVGKRASKSGMDFPDACEAIKNIHGEVDELSEAAASGDMNRTADELGDVLFSCVNAARKLGLNSEECLTAATEKFIKRFAAVESAVRSQGRKMENCSLEELDSIWNNIKHTI
ncbi:MAG: nucleoside triphosphate pyrophosphohydrolase [Oscillospiraceae bacterium]|nr:nucleoside triphosphate pyrophosphohydrolase [Oscillospiraceae bacterium]